MEKKTGILVTEFDGRRGGISTRWFEVIEERTTSNIKAGVITRMQKEELDGIAAFLGNQLVKYLGGRWFHYLVRKSMRS